MGRKRNFQRGGYGKKKRRKKNLVEINEKAKRHIEKEKEKKHLQELRFKGQSVEQKPVVQEDLDNSSESEVETSVYDELLTSLKEGGKKNIDDGFDSDGESEKEEEIEEQTLEDEDGSEGVDKEEKDGKECSEDDGSEEDIDDDSNADSDDGDHGNEHEDDEHEEDDKHEDDDKHDDDDDDIADINDEKYRDWEEEQDSSSNDEMEDDDGETMEIKKNNKDPYYIRVHSELSEKEVEEMKLKKIQKVADIKWPELGQMMVLSSSESSVVTPSILKETAPNLHIRKRLFDQWPSVNKTILGGGQTQMFSSLQRELYSAMNSYMDLMYPEVAHDITVEVRNVYCLHILNHVVKTRSTVQKHNNFLSTNPGADTDDMRDQGLTRPKVLIVVPFRYTVMQVVNTIIDLLLPKDSQHVSHRKRFNEEFGDKYSGKTNPKKPEDWQKTFAGNIDDHFKIGIALSKKSLKLYTQFYQSDIIIASPLGLRTIIGSKGESHQDFDFLSSIEILVMEQTDVFLMQNWEHVLHLLDYMHLQPKDSHGVDFSRVRMWALNGWNKFFRQTLVFSQLACPEIKAVMNKNCKNFSGQLCVSNPSLNGAVCQVATQLQQVFQRIKVDSFVSDPDERFKIFTTKVLPQYKDALLKGTMIFIPSYFDYVRVRNYFRKEGLNFCQICEYSNTSEVSRVRQYLIKGSRHFVLYTERFHFFHRIKMRGIHHIIFYQPPTYPHFYSELCNMMQSPDKTSEITCRIIYSKYDSTRIARIVGMKRCGQMMSSLKDVHMLVSGEGT